MSVSIQLTDRAESDLKDLGFTAAKRIADKLQEIGAHQNPMVFAKRLSGNSKGYFDSV